MESIIYKVTEKLESHEHYVSTVKVIVPKKEKENFIGIINKSWKWESHKHKGMKSVLMSGYLCFFEYKDVEEIIIENLVHEDYIKEKSS